MANAYVFNKHLDIDDCALIEAAIEAAGYVPVYSVPANVLSLNPDSEIGVVGLPVASEDLATVDSRIQIFVGAGVRVVGVWLRGEDKSGTGIPEGIEKYATTVDAGSAELTTTLKGESEVWEEPGGAPRPTPKTARNKC